MYASSNIEAPSCNNYCRGEAISIMYSECVVIALVLRHKLRMRRTIYGLLGYTICFNINT